MTHFHLLFGQFLPCVQNKVTVVKDRLISKHSCFSDPKQLGSFYLHYVSIVPHFLAFVLQFVFDKAKKLKNKHANKKKPSFLLVHHDYAIFIHISSDTLIF